MLNIKKVECDTKQVRGLSIRTTNEEEKHSDTRKITSLWGRFYAEILPTLDRGTLVYGVYHNYESDASGAYDVTVGSDTFTRIDNMKSVELEAGKYLLFPVKGELPQAIVDTWMQVWAYFEDPSIDERRAYETDFELYKSGDEVEIYIGVHYF